MREISAAVADPVWGLWLGRKTCIPSSPVLAGLKEDRDDALRLLIGEMSLESFTRQEDVENFADGRDSLPDMPVSLATEGGGNFKITVFVGAIPAGRPVRIANISGD